MRFTKRAEQASNKRIKTSFFEWFEVKVCILKSEAVINDQNGVLFFDTLYILRYIQVLIILILILQ